MTTVPDIMCQISKNIQCTFEELIKLLLRRTLRPCPDGSVNNYSYIMTSECIGWDYNAVTSFKIYPKGAMRNGFLVTNALFSRANVIYSYRDQSVVTRAIRLNSIVSPCKRALAANQPFATAVSNAVSCNELREGCGTGSCSQGKCGGLPVIPPPPVPAGPAIPVVRTNFVNAINILSPGNTMLNLIANNRTGHAYTCDVPFNDCWKQLLGIGSDILNEIDPLVQPCDSARLPTALLRVKLFCLEKSLADLSVNYPDIYCSYLQMIVLINSIQNVNLPWVTNLIGTLSVQPWSTLLPVQKQTYINVLGQDFVDGFISNELITILLQADTPETILTASYLYSLMKMLFIVFGFVLLRPEITDCPPVNCLGQCGTACERVRACDVEFISTFCNLYPTITEMMGLCNEIPEPGCCLPVVDPLSIPPTYCGLASIPEFLLRFFYFSYFEYATYINSRILITSLGARINTKVRYLNIL